MATKAIAYVSDIILGRTGEVISREAQKELIRQYAQESDIEIVAWFEDEIYQENILARPGIMKLLASTESCDTVLVERVWSLSRKSEDLRGFLKALDAKGKKLQSTSILWDCVSQMARWYYRRKDVGPRACQIVKAEETASEAKKVARPQRLAFLNLKRKPHPV